MKKTILILTGFLSTIGLKAQTWNVDPVHTNVNFNVEYMLVSDLDGSFKVFDGKIESVKPDFTDAKINFNVDVNSVNTDNEMRDKHLKADDFFNAEKYPKMSFKSTSMKKVSDKKYELEGDLTIRDVTKRVKFDVTYGGTVNDPWGNTKAGFKASGKIKRFDYGLKYNQMTEAGGLAAGNEVAMNLNLIFVKQK